MSRLLILLFVRNSENVNNPKVHAAYGMLSGAVGVFCNVMLTVLKLFVGNLTGSISIVADAINNLSDAASSAVTLFGFKAASRPADEEHPFGHGRIEYISALIVSFLILLMGVELVKTSVKKIITPSPVAYSTVGVVILLASILVKLWMAYFNNIIGKKINSPAMRAVVIDSISDTSATGITIIALVASRYTALPVDAYVGIVVAIFIFISGINILRDTIGTLIGKAPSPELVKKIEEKILSYDEIVGVHDLIVHSYGANRIFACAHAEVPADVDMLQGHDTIDVIEREISNEFGIDMLIHLDPIVVDDEYINKLHTQTTEIISNIDEQLKIHDFRVVEGPTHTNLIFDLVTPHRYKISEVELRNRVSQAISEINENYYVVMTVESSYV